MSGLAIINLVDNEEMSSQGSVNTPMAPGAGAMADVPSPQTPSELPR